MSVALLGLVLTACASPQAPDGANEPRPGFEGATELVAGEPVFEEDVRTLVAEGVPEGRALSRLRTYALLASMARRDPARVPERDLEMARKRAAVRLYLGDLRRSIEPPSEDALRARHAESEDPRPFYDVVDELREALEIERAFARVAERVAAGAEELAPIATPEALPDLGALRFATERAP